MEAGRHLDSISIASSVDLVQNGQSLGGNLAADRRTWMVTLFCIVFALGTLGFPVAYVHTAPLLDYPNHMARMWLLAGGADHAPLNAIYAVNWSGASTNIGIDLLAATLGRLIGVGLLGKLLLAAAVLLPPLGAVLLNRSVFGGWHWWQAGFPVLAWNATLLMGFVNFQIGLGLALLAASADPLILCRTRPSGAALTRMALATALLVFHPFAAGFYAVLLTGIAFGAGREPFVTLALFGRAFRRAIQPAALGAGVPVACFLLLAPTIPGSHAPPGAYDFWENLNFSYKFISLVSGFLTYNLYVDTIMVSLLWVCGRVFAFREHSHCHSGLLLATLGLFVLTIVTPPTLAGTAFLDWRFSGMALLTGVAAVRPGLPSARAGGVAAVALMSLAFVRTGWITVEWQECQGDIIAVEQVLAFVPAGAAVLPAHHTVQEKLYRPYGLSLTDVMPWYQHLQSLAVPLCYAFVPTLFTAPGKQPLRVLPPWTDIAVFEGNDAPVQFLRFFTPSPQLTYAFGYVAQWRERFSYILVLNAQAPVVEDESTLPELELLADRGFARLYRIRH